MDFTNQRSKDRSTIHINSNNYNNDSNNDNNNQRSKGQTKNKKTNNHKNCRELKSLQMMRIRIRILIADFCDVSSEK